MGGGDKALRALAGRPLLSYVIDALRPQVGALAISANGDPTRFARWTLPMLADPFPDQGPLAGILAGLRWTQGPLLSVAGDTPFLPEDLAARLAETARREQSEVVVAARGGVLQPVIALWSPGVADALERALSAPGERSVESFLRARKWAVASFDDGPDPFFNINTPADLAAAEALLTSK